ncbi:hypothetical protein [Streptosporangium sp. KLBMP 9127]|nr:hypothetical protein [Streptosporangium sp. KLBMP 9127]
MSAGEEIFDSPTGWVAEHIRLYADSEGAHGHQYQGWPAMTRRPCGVAGSSRWAAAVAKVRPGELLIDRSLRRGPAPEGLRPHT